MQVEYNYLPKQFEDIEAYIADIRELVKSTEFTLGPYVEKFEKKFAEYVGAKYCLSTNTGTDALILALKALDIGPGDEVITVANTFYATAGAIVAVGAKPIFVDCDKRMQMNHNLIESAINEKTKAILPVHWAGASPDMLAIMKIAKKYNLLVVEDACPAVGAYIDKTHAGTFGDIGCFSMHPLKPLNVWGDGGMFVTDREDVYEWFMKYRNHGMSDRNHIDIWGINSRLQPLQAIVATRLLDEIEADINQKIKNVAYLDERLRNELADYVVIPERPHNYREVYQICIYRFKNRDNLIQHLIDNGIEAKIHYPVPLHLQKPALEYGNKKGDCPEAEKQADEIITLPVHRFIGVDKLEYMVNKIKEFYGV